MTLLLESAIQRCNDICETQLGLANVAQCRAARLDKWWIGREVRRGTMHRPLPNVYFRGPSLAAMTEDAWKLAAVLACGDAPACLSHTTAARGYRTWERGDTTIHVTSTARRPDVPERGIVYHHAAVLPDREIVTVSRLPCARFDRTLAGCAALLTPLQLTHVISEGIFRQRITESELYAALDGSQGRRGATVLRAAVGLYRAGSAGTRSTWEDVFHDACCTHGLPEPRVNDPGAAGLLGIEVDFAWPEQRIAVFIDGRIGHDRPNNVARDTGQDAALRAAGWIVVRFRPADLRRDLHGCVAVVARHLAGR